MDKEALFEMTTLDCYELTSSHSLPSTDPLTNESGTVPKCNTVPFAAREELYGLVVDECHISQIQDQWAAAVLRSEYCPQFIDLLTAYPAAY